MGALDFVDMVVHMCIVAMLAKIFIAGFSTTMFLSVAWWAWHQLLKFEKGL